MPYCLNCGQRVAPRVHYCPRCSTPNQVRRAGALLPSGGFKPVPSLWGITAVFLLLAMVVGAIALEATDIMLLGGGVTVIVVAVWEEVRKAGSRR